MRNIINISTKSFAHFTQTDYMSEHSICVYRWKLNFVAWDNFAFIVFCLPRGDQHFVSSKTMAMTTYLQHIQSRVKKPRNQIHTWMEMCCFFLEDEKKRSWLWTVIIKKLYWNNSITSKKKTLIQYNKKSTSYNT